MSIRLVVGLGNDDSQYDNTPHNIGFAALDCFAKNAGLSWKDEKGQARVALWGEVRLIKPCSYMNVSGEKVQWAAHWWKVTPEETLVVFDDFALPWGQLRLRPQGSSGGHNGLTSVVQHLATQTVPRLRVGIGPVPERMETKDFVLKKVSPEKMLALAETAAAGLAVVLEKGVSLAMNSVNAVPPEENNV